MIKQFFIHIFPKTFCKDTLKPAKTLYLGGLLTALFIFLGVSGALLLFYYSPETSSAYKSVLFLEERVFGGRFIRSLHRMTSHIFLVLLALHFARTVFTGAYAARRSNWKLGFLLFGLMVFEAYTGYLLPMDQLSLWATKTGMELVSILPFGSWIRSLLTPDDVGGRLSLMRFFALHIMIIPVTALTLISAHLYNVRRDGGLLARDNTEKIKSDPHLYRLAAIIGASAVILTVVLSVIFGAPLCEPANPAEPPNPAKSAWFLLWIQEIVSWRASLFNAVALLFVLYFFLPDFRKSYTPESSVWFDKRDTLVWGITLLICASAIVLTVIAMFFRGENWSLVPFYF